MKTNAEIRRENLSDLADEFHGVAKLADRLHKSPAQVSQWINASKDSKTKKPRGISDDMARHIEECCEKERGWMDNDHTDKEAEAFKKLPKEVRSWLIQQGNPGNKSSAQKNNGTQ